MNTNPSQRPKRAEPERVWNTASLLDAALWLGVQALERASNWLASLFMGREPDDDED